MMVPVDSQERNGASAGSEDPVVTRFESQTSVTRLGPGSYGAVLDRSWWIVAGPNGGYVAAVVLRAMVDAIDDPDRPVRSMTIQYLRPPAVGEVTISVTIERAGRTVSNVTARMIQDGKPVALALAAFGVDRDDTIGFDETDGLAEFFGDSPVPTPEQIPVSELDPDRDVPMRGHYDLRWVLGDLPFSAITTGSTGSASSGSDAPVRRRALCGGWLRPAEPVPIDEVVLAAMSDAWMPPVFSRAEVELAVPTVDLTIHFRALPPDPLGFCFVFFDSPLASSGYIVEHGRILSPEGRLLVESRQLAVLI